MHISNLKNRRGTRQKNEMKRILFIAILICVSALMTSCGTINYGGAARGALAGYSGYTFVGYCSSESECISLIKSKGYTQYFYDASNGASYGK